MNLIEITTHRGNVHYRSHKLPMQAQCLQLLVTPSQRTCQSHQTTQAVATVLTRHQTLVSSQCWRHYLFWSGDMEKPSWYWSGSAFYAGWVSWYLKVPCGLLGDLGDGRQQCYLLVDKASCSHNHVKYVHDCNRGINVLGVTNHFLIRSKAHSAGGSTCPAL